MTTQVTRDKLKRSADLLDSLASAPEGKKHVVVFVQLPENLWTSAFSNGKAIGKDDGDRMIEAQSGFAASTYDALQTAGYEITSSRELAAKAHRVCISADAEKIRQLLDREDVHSASILSETANGRSASEIDQLAMSQKTKTRAG
jgi:hypothetical protein